MRPLSLDLRERVIAALQSGQTRPEIAQRFSISVGTVGRLAKQWREQKHLSPRPITGYRQAPCHSGDGARTPANLDHHTRRPNTREFVQSVRRADGQEDFPVCLAAQPDLAGLLVQKKSRIAKERNPAKRAAFLEAIAKVDPKKLVFLDEAGFSLALFLFYGWALREERLVESVPLNRGKNLSVLGAFGAEGMLAQIHKVGAMKRVDVERFLESDLLSRLPPGSVLVLDNARIHHGGRIEEIVTAAGCSILYLSPYSPDFSPIELN